MTQKKDEPTLAGDLADGVTRVTAKQAAVEVLRRAKTPLRSDEIARRVMKTKGVRLAGATPEATVTAMLAVESNKPDGLFRRTEKATYALRESAGTKRGERAKASA